MCAEVEQTVPCTYFSLVVLNQHGIGLIFREKKVVWVCPTSFFSNKDNMTLRFDLGHSKIQSLGEILREFELEIERNRQGYILDTVFHPWSVKGPRTFFCSSKIVLYLIFEAS